VTNHLLGLSLATMPIKSVVKNPIMSSHAKTSHGTIHEPRSGRNLDVRDALSTSEAATQTSEHMITMGK